MTGGTSEPLWAEFAARYGKSQAGRAVMARAPGRVNLLGEHTDYNEGFVLPIAISFSVRIVGAPRDDRKVRVYSLDLDQADEFDLDAVERCPGHDWRNYFRGVTRVLLDAGHALGGMDAAIAGDVPQGAGLSSSAAFEVAAAVLMRELFGLNLPQLELVQLCQRAEHEFAGVACGIMDQFVSGFGREGQAVLLDCRDLSHSYHPLRPDLAAVVVVNSGVKHSLASSAYNQRRRECAEGAAAFRRLDPAIGSLRDVTPAMLAAHGAGLEPAVLRRCRHVVEENARTLGAVEALAGGDMARFGRLMYESHASLRDLYEVSCAELDALVELARAQPGVFGARMTGGGFGGCTVNLVRPDRVASFIAEIGEGYLKVAGRKPEIYVCRAAAGAGIAGRNGT